MRSVVTKLSILFLLACVAPAAAGAERILLVVGDSLSAGFGLEPGRGWVTLLQSRLETEGYGYRVVNASISGDTTGGGVSRLPRLLEQHRPEVVLIELGGNDGLRGTPVDVVRRNLTTMVGASRKAGARVVLAQMVMPPNYGLTYTDAFAGVYPAVAREQQVPLAGFLLDGVALDPTLMQADGIHANEKGQPKLLDNDWPVLSKSLAPTGAKAPAKASTSGENRPAAPRTHSASPPADAARH
jgi:acyl-CoA thioesterase-1